MEAVNTYTGNTVINAGIFEIGASGGLYHGGYRNNSFLIVNTGGTVRVPIFSYNANGAGQGDLGGLPDYSDHRQLDGGTLEVTGNSHSSGNDFRVGLAGGTFRYTATGETLSLNGNANDNIRLSGPLTFDAVGNIAVAEVIQNGTAPGSIVKTGAGTLTLTGTNTYSGNTTVNEGVLAVDGDALANGTSLIIDGGLVEATGTETVDTLFFGAAQQAAGTWGATGSGATHIDDTRFAGTAGVINVTSGPGLAYTTWSAANANGDDSDLESDGDGVPNGVEFLMGQNGTSFTPNPALVNGTVTWPKNPAALANWVIQTSNNLQDQVTPGDGGWTIATTGVTDNGSSIEFTPPTGAGKLFIRLRVAVP
ncbi:MAG: autotransporter-associated beta strand repeat-containing protein [Verrucomicrobiae bacterium]|nr:autotransporter-associated beta strand repeat-containing protein [Verrucomicrobiae bacterium]